VITAAITGALAGVAMGYVLQRGQLCFHSTIKDSLDGRFLLARGWALGVALASVGLALLFLLPGTDGLNQGLAFRPIANVVGGLVIGVGMVVARSCVSGLFYKLGSGMLGALVGLAGWAAGELLARQLTLPGPTVLPGGEAATLPGVLGLPRLLVAALLLTSVAVALWRRPGRESPDHDWQWGWRRIGVGLGVAITTGWALAALGGSSFGPSSVGAVVSVAGGSPNYWLITFLLGIVAGGTLSARTAGGFWLRGEETDPLPPARGRWPAPRGRWLDRRGLQPRARAIRCGAAQRLVTRRRGGDGRRSLDRATRPTSRHTLVIRDGAHAT